MGILTGDTGKMSNLLKKKQIRHGLAGRLKTVRKEKALSQFDLASALHVTQGLVSQYESAQVEISLIVLLDLCGVLGCSADYLLGLDVPHDDTPRGRLMAAFEKLGESPQKVIVAGIEAIVKELREAQK